MRVVSRRAEVGKRAGAGRLNQVWRKQDFEPVGVGARLKKWKKQPCRPRSKRERKSPRPPDTQSLCRSCSPPFGNLHCLDNHTTSASVPLEVPVHSSFPPVAGRIAIQPAVLPVRAISAFRGRGLRPFLEHKGEAGGPSGNKNSSLPCGAREIEDVCSAANRSQPDPDIETNALEAVLTFHGGNARAAIATLLGDCPHLR